MKQSTWDLIESEYRECANDYVGPVPYEEVDNLTRQAGIILDPDYREFIHRYGSGYIGAYLVYGLGLPKYGPPASPKTFWELTKYFREEGWPYVDEWVIISEDLSGNPFGMDKEGKVWTYDHDCGQLFDVGENFEDFILNECLRPDDDEEEGNEEDSDDE